MVDGKQGQFETVGDPDLIKYAAQMMLHGLFADGIFFGDLTIRETGYDRLHHIQFARRQPEILFGILGLTARRRQIWAQNFYQIGDAVFANPEFAAHYGVNAF